MSLESDIQELTIAIRALTHAFNESKTLNAVVTTYGKAETFDSEKEMVAAIVKPAEDVPNAKPSTTTDTSPSSSNESRTVTYDDVKNVTIAVSKNDKAKAVAGLARFGVQTAKALTEDQWLDYVVYMERVAKGEIDPESSHE